MKKLILLGMLGFASAIATTAQAQVSINVSIGSQPRWTPVYEEVAYTPVVTRYYEPAPRYVAVRHYAPVRRYVPARHYYTPAPRRYYAPRHEVRYVRYDKAHGHGRGGKHGHDRH
jgi:hypothetical protein